VLSTCFWSFPWRPKLFSTSLLQVKKKVKQTPQPERRCTHLAPAEGGGMLAVFSSHLWPENRWWIGIILPLT
jgi:hypothetical protein